MGSSSTENQNQCGVPQHIHSSYNNSSASVTILSVPSTSSWATEEIEVGYQSPSPTPPPPALPEEEHPPHHPQQPIEIVECDSGKGGRSLSIASEKTHHSFNSIQNKKKLRLRNTLAGLRPKKKNAMMNHPHHNVKRVEDDSHTTTTSFTTQTTHTNTHTRTHTHTHSDTNSDPPRRNSSKPLNVTIGKTSEMESYPEDDHDNTTSKPEPRVLLHTLNRNHTSRSKELEGIPETNSVLPLNQNSNSQRRQNSTSSRAPPQIPMEWPKQQYSQQMQEWHDRELQTLEVEQAGRRRRKERDGFCRRVDRYDGQTICLEGKDAYELGSYLGDGVAGVVYEARRLLPTSEYPIRRGLQEESEADLEETKSTQRLEYENPSNLPANDLGLENNSSHSHTMEETVAVKILNPVGFRILHPSDANSAIVVQEGEPLTNDMKLGLEAMTERHVWWLINPNSRNLRTLLKTPPPIHAPKTFLDNKDVTVLGTHSSTDSYTTQSHSYYHTRGEYVDRGTPHRGLKLSLIAAFPDPKTGQLRELPLTKCIEIWGHAPFGASEEEFETMMDAIERVNEGRAPVNGTKISYPSGYSISGSTAPTRVMTADSSAWSEDLSSWTPNNTSSNGNKQSMHSERSTSGLFRAAASERTIVFCKPLTAYIGVPAVPPKYLRWLRQRRAATREIRNMMRIGRHKNVVHLYEVLEYIQETQSTMFLILELVKGGELFDLISSNASSPIQCSEMVMLKFFQELVSGIAYCHANGIAHRDLKPENLLVHHGVEGEECTLKIADFGLSAAFALSSRNSNSILVESSKKMNERTLSATTTTYPQSPKTPTPASPEPVTGLSPLFPGIPTLTDLSTQALSLFTCGQRNLEELCNSNDTVEELPSEPMRRMTSVVGSPHYVAPEIISQPNKEDVPAQTRGYDGTKADVWSSGVILYAMLFRSLPFGEDLIRCPRYQSFYKWYKFARKKKSRRSSAEASLNPDYTPEEIQDMLGPHWFFPSHTSVESKDLIMTMLNPDAEKRISIQQVLQHPWLTQQNR